MNVDPYVLRWAGRTGWWVDRIRGGVRFGGQDDRPVLEQLVRGSTARVERVVEGEPRRRVPEIEARALMDTDRYLVNFFGGGWVLEQARHRAGIGPFAGKAPSGLKAQTDGRESVVLDRDGAVRARFAGTVPHGNARSFVRYADLPLDEMTRRLEAAADAARRAVADSGRPGRLRRAGPGVRFERVIEP